MAESKKKGRWKRRLLWFVGVASVLAVAFALWYRVPPKARFPGYAHDVAHAPAPGTEAEAGASLRAGFATRDITPKVGDGEDTVWLAGFRFGRSATGVHDSLWARALVIETCLLAGGLALARFLAGPDTAQVAFAIWGFFLVQSFFFLLGGVAERAESTAGLDSFEVARARALALMEGDV